VLAVKVFSGERNCVAIAKTWTSRQTSQQQTKIACQKEGMMLIAPVLYTAANVDPALGAVLLLYCCINGIRPDLLNRFGRIPLSQIVPNFGCEELTASF